MRQVQYKEGKDFADSFGAFFAETTIKDSSTIDAAFQILIKMVYINKTEEMSKPTPKKNYKKLYAGHYTSNMEEKKTKKDNDCKC
ncbi:unnamed protein product [Moneuplotes crassus]|uniref:Uncharacterized protein n=1 Tax=Euplotes crassus TaxID=5936 RepID=A0AAD1X7A4_EUPCR|nr:unnamed protein product [Moneuplotes crassus]